MFIILNKLFKIDEEPGVDFHSLFKENIFEKNFEVEDFMRDIGDGIEPNPLLIIKGKILIMME